jgi:hypothetical protein
MLKAEPKQRLRNCAKLYQADQRHTALHGIFECFISAIDERAWLLDRSSLFTTATL